MPVKKADKSSNQDPGSTPSKKMIVLLMECNDAKCKVLCKALEEAGFDVYVCNDLSSCLHVLRCNYPLGFALVAPTINGRDGYMEIIRVFCSEQEIPLKVINDKTTEEIIRQGVHFAQIVY